MKSINWQNKTSGILGLFMVGLAFAGFSDTLFRVLVVVLGSVVVILSFFGHRIFKSEAELIEAEEGEIDVDA